VFTNSAIQARTSGCLPHQGRAVTGPLTALPPAVDTPDPRANTLRRQIGPMTWALIGLVPRTPLRVPAPAEFQGVLALFTPSNFPPGRPRNEEDRTIYRVESGLREMAALAGIYHGQYPINVRQRAEADYFRALRELAALVWPL